MTTVPTTHNILLAEDNDFNQEIVVELLTEAGYTVSAQNNGQELLKELRDKPDDFYHLILMDLEMPILDGHQTTVEIRKQHQFDQIPIIAMTAHTLESTKIRCAQEGMQDFISKPFNPTALYAIIHKWSRQTQEFSIDMTSGMDASINSFLSRFNFKTLDSNRGLQLSGNNIDLYLQLLERFRVSQVANLLHLSQVTETDLLTTEFKRMIHTLKGVSATIGGSQLANLIEEFEAYLATSSAQQISMTSANTYLVEIRNLLKLSIDEISQFFLLQNPTTTLIKPSSNNSIELPLLIESLIALLEAASTDAVDFFHKHETTFELAFEHQQFLLLTTNINQYDFDLAIKQLRSCEVVNSRIKN